MRALTARPPTPNSAEVRDVPDPEVGPQELLVEGLALGICGTDREIAAGEYGWAPPARDRLVLGHEWVHVLDLPTEGPKPRAVRALGAQYHCGGIGDVTARAKPDDIKVVVGLTA